MNPVVALASVNNPALADVAQSTSDKLQRVIESL